MLKRLYSSFSTFFLRSIFLRKFAFIVFSFFSFYFSGQIIHDESNSLFITEGTTLSVTDTMRQYNAKPTDRAIRKLPEQNKKLADNQQKKSRPKKTETVKQYASKDSIMISASGSTQSFALSKSLAASAAIPVTSQAQNPKVFLQKKTEFLSFFPDYQEKHISSYRRSHLFSEIFSTYPCRPPPYHRILS